MNKFYYILLTFTLLIGWGEGLSAQTMSAERYEIDMKRGGIRLNDREALLRAREFIRLDPTYYVGYMLEGLYKYEHSSDFIGYKNAIPPLKKAFELIEQDYGNAFKARYTETDQYVAVEDRFLDYYRITYNLIECYSNIDRPDSVIWLLKEYNKWNMQHDILGADNYIAWTYHRNRYYTSDKFAFLYNSVKENERTALNYLKQNLKKVEEKSALNEEVLSWSMVMSTRLSVYHYLALVYDYLRQPDSARYYYDQMRPYNVFSYNNYAIFCFVNGDFEESYKNFYIDAFYSRKDKMLQESIFYLSILNAMRGLPQNSVKPLIGYIEDNKVRPGWGWYNIGLGRAYLYNGQLEESAACLKKATGFREITIGSTLGTSQYNFSYALLDLINLEKQAAAIKFEDKRYWLSPKKLLQLANLNVQQSTVRLALFNQLSANLERDELYYRLFASESTVSWDEIYSLVKDYGRSFFIKKFELEAGRKGRDNIRKYFTLLQAKLYIEKSRIHKAKRILDELDKTQHAETGFENLYRARLYEALAICEDDVGTKKAYESNLNKFYMAFPQLVPYSDLKMEFYLDLKDNDNKTAKTVINELKSCNISWTNNKDKEVPRVIVRFSGNGKQNMLTYKVESAWGKTIVSPQDISYDEPGGVGKKLAYGIFKVGAEGAIEDEFYY
ncbi:MAG: hypothetical protein LBL90_02825 [Prevotellaceae bacterium]|jgi:hypothetical protein|nr:hypothetical protein [Prevotellaceae bacterium]